MTPKTKIGITHRHRHGLLRSACALLVVCIAATLSLRHPAHAAANSAPSSPQNLYADSVRTSQYVTVRDGTRLAIDIYRPASNGRPVDTKLPVILVATPYHRSSENNGEILTFLAPQGNHRNIFAEVLRHGYIIASLDIRGRGASFGTAYAGGMDNDGNRWDLYDVVEWLAVQPWSDGSIGMGGCSYVGKTQFLAASVAPPHLKAIAPTGAPFAAYDLARENGVTRDLLSKLDQGMQALDITYPAPPVDEDRDGSLRQAAINEHRKSWDAGLAGFTPERKVRPFRDSLPAHPEWAYPTTDEWNYLPNYKLSKIPVFQYSGWRDLTLEAVATWYQGLAGVGATQKIIIGPWYHCEWDQSDLTDAAQEYVNWYDYWLKGAKNGEADGPRVRYYVVGAPAGQEWQSAKQWPLPNEQPATYYLAGKSAARASDATLRLDKPGASGGEDHYVVDYTASTADLATRFYWGIPNIKNPGLVPLKTSALDAKSLTYTTAPLTRDTELTGFPRIKLFVTSTARGQDFFAYIEDVDEQGESTMLTDGVLRASNRATRTPPFDNGGRPWHPHLQADQAELTPGVPAELEFVLHPMSFYIRKGHRLRVTINNFDKDSNWDTPQIQPPPTVTILHDAQHPSSITLPFVAKANLQ